MQIEEIDKKRFDAFVHQSRSPGVAYVSEEQSWWATPDESVIGVVIRDTVDNDFLGIACGTIASRIENASVLLRFNQCVNVTDSGFGLLVELNNLVIFQGDHFKEKTSREVLWKITE